MGEGSSGRWLAGLSAVLALAMIVAVMVQRRREAKGDGGSISLAARVEKATRSGDAAGLRELAAKCVMGHPSLARQCFHTLEQRKLATEADRCEHARLLARLHDFPGATAVLGGKPAQMSEMTAPVRAAWINLWTESGDFVSAAGALESITSCDLPEVNLALNAATAAQRQSADDDVKGRIEQCLITMLQAAVLAGGEKEIAAPLKEVLNLSLRGAPQRVAAAELFRRLSALNIEQRLALVRLGFPATPAAAAHDALRSALRQCVQSAGALQVDEKAAVADFLLGQQEHELVREVISLPEARSDMALMSRRMEALIALGDWREVGRMRADVSLPPVVWARSLVHAAVALQTPGDSLWMAEALVNRVIDEAVSERRWASALTAGKMALDHRLPQIATRAFDAAIRLAPNQAAALERVGSIARGFDRGLSVVRLAASAALRPTQDDEAELTLAYLDRLAGLSPAASAGESPDHIFLRAFDFYRQGKVNEALSAIKDLPRHRWHQGQAAIIGSILAAAGQAEAAAALFEGVNRDFLYAEELAIAEPWMNGHALGLGLAAGPLLGYETK